MTTALPARRRWVILVLVTLLGSLVGVAPAAGAGDASALEALAENLFHEAHLEVRAAPASHGVTDFPAAPPADGRTDVLDVARAWSAQMATNGTLAHNPSFGDQLCCWIRAGENVGRFSANIQSEDDVRRAVTVLMEAWIESDGHRANLMDARWDEFAVGVVIANGTMWATTNFRTLASSAAPPGETYGADGPNAVTTTVSARARDITSVCADARDAGYVDTNGNAHEDAIRCATGLGLARGRGDGTYDPTGSVTRAQAVAFLHRAVIEAGHDLPSDGVDHFVDDNGTFIEDAANQLASAGFLRTGSNRLNPSAVASRAFIADTAGRAVEALTATGAADDYFDDDDGLPQELQINVLATAGVVTGNGNRGFGPSLGLSRAQVATVLVRTYDALAA